MIKHFYDIPFPLNCDLMMISLKLFSFNDYKVIKTESKQNIR